MGCGDITVGKNRFVTNTSWIVSGHVVKMLISFVINIITVRYLGPSNYGIINYVNSYIAFFTTLVGLGLNGVIIYEFANHKEENGKILGTAIVLRFVAGIISILAFMLIIFVTDGNDPVIIITAALQAIQLPFLSLDTINYWYQSRLQSRYPVICQTTAHFVTSIYKVYLLATGKSVAWFGFAVSLDVVILGVTYFLIYRRHKDQDLACSLAIARRILRACGPFILANMMVVVYGQIDKIMIKHMLGSDAEVGLYSAAIVICSLVGFLPLAILDSSRPMIVETKSQDADLYKLRVKQLVAGIIWICVAYSIFVMAGSRILIRLLFGDAYLGANVPLKIAVWYTAFSYLGSVKSLWLICEGKNRYVFVFSVMGAGCNIVMNAVMIPIWGIIGAALSTLITQILVNVLFPAVFKDTREYSELVFDVMSFKDTNVKEVLKRVVERLPWVKQSNNP